MHARRIAAALTMLLPALGAGSAGAASAPPSAIEERVRSVEVQIPVDVTVKGRPVRGLSAEQFEIWDRGKRQEITGFRVVDLTLHDPGGDALGGDVPIAGRRHFLLVFDLSFAEPASIFRAREQMRTWAAESLHPTDLVAVATYGANRGATLVLNFTSDRRQIGLAIASLGSPDLVERTQDPLGLAVGTALVRDLSQAEFTSLLDGSTLAADDDAMNGAMRDIFYGAAQPNMRQNARQPIRQFSQQFGGLARLLDSVKGRKHVVYFSEGFDASLVFSADDPEQVARINDDVASGAYWRVDSSQRFGSTSTQTELQEMLDAFRRADCVIQAIDIKAFGEARDSRVLPASADALAMLANSTGGQLYRSFRDIPTVMEQMLERTSVTYLLSFAPRDLEDDGKFHKLKVKLRDGPAGAQIDHRPGYFAPRPYGEKGVDERRLIASELILDGRVGGEIRTEVLAAPFRTASGPALVPVLVEVAGDGLLEAMRQSKLAAEIYVYAFDVHGTLGDFFTQTVNVDLERESAVLRSSGLKFYGELALGPGEYSLRVLVLNRETGRSGMQVAALRVPDFAAGSPELLPPLFPEPRGKWLLARDASDASALASFPFMLQEQPYLPAANPSIAEGERVHLCVLAYNVDVLEVTLAGRVLAADGTRVREIELPVHGSSRWADLAPETLITTLDTAGLARGQYTLVVTLDDGKGNRKSSSMPFAVVATAGRKPTG